MRAKKVFENISFERGRDPKEALGIGVWKDGYRVDKQPDFIVPEEGYVRIDFKGDEWNFDKKNFDSMDISKTQVDPDMAKKLEPLPVVTFKTFYEWGGVPGMFGDWDRDTFPFRLTPFIANVEEAEGRSFLIDPEGYEYPRYITELV